MVLYLLFELADVVEDLDGFPAVVVRGVVLVVDFFRGRCGKACGAARASRTANGMSVAVRVQTDIAANACKTVAFLA